ncbi:MAG: hypothetical protein MUP66_03575 [Candidatus Nanohaloarchaeota archaeon QJJ-5]|nr:hypothetical protein [Candidatus Nanohaloarchaeota archaeon QJJ-5]
MGDEYSLWLQPPSGSVPHERLSSRIRDYADQYDTPVFPPHVTVVGGVGTDRETIEKVAGSITSGETAAIRLVKASWSVTRHQCVFLLVDPSSWLISLHEKARTYLDHPSNFYVPHLSLVYGDIGHAERESCAEKASDLVPMSFKPSEIRVVDTSGRASTWKTVTTTTFDQ